MLNSLSQATQGRVALLELREINEEIIFYSRLFALSADTTSIAA
jgi:hypothetical protein